MKFLSFKGNSRHVWLLQSLLFVTQYLNHSVVFLNSTPKYIKNFYMWWFDCLLWPLSVPCISRLTHFPTLTSIFQLFPGSRQSLDSLIHYFQPSLIWVLAWISNSVLPSPTSISFHSSDDVKKWTFFFFFSSICLCLFGLTVVKAVKGSVVLPSWFRSGQGVHALIHSSPFPKPPEWLF